MQGVVAFAKLCDDLIADGENYLYPCIERTRQTGWLATIRNRPNYGVDESRSYIVSQGEDQTMDAACQQAVDDYAERQRVQRRKEELQRIPEVVEALQLFNVKP